LEMVAWLRQWGVQRVVMESTSTYWKGVYYLLEAEGFECWLVNAREVKNVPGRAKTDLLTELPARCRRGCVPYRARLARFATRDQRCGCAA
jgi:transposase